MTVIVRGSSDGENDCNSSGGGTSWGDNSEVFVSTCESYYWQASGQTYTQSGTYESSLGDTLHLTIYHGDALETSKTACQSYTWDVTGQTYTESGDYVFPYINNNGCPSTRTLHLTLSTPAVSVQPIAPVTVCSGEDVAFSATATGTGPINYSWKGPNAFSSSDNSISIPDATAGASGVYTLTATTVMGTCIATATTTVQVTVVASPQIEVTGNHPLCAGDSLTLTATGAQIYHWSNGITSPSITVFPSLSTTYTVTGTDNHGCAGTAEVLVTVNPIPVVAISGNTSICKGKSTTLYASGASSYVWSTGFNGSSLAVAPSNSATYSVTGTSAYGCSASDTIVVTVRPKPDVDVTGNSPVCAGESVTLSASGADSYVWSSGGGTGSSITLNPTSSKSYTVTGTTIYGCTATASKSITVHPKPNVSMIKSGPICAGDALILTASGASSYAWSNGMTGNPIVEFPYQNTKFIVVGTNSYGCTGSDSLSIQVNPLPNIFIIGEAEVCYGEEITLTAAGASTYSWSSGSGSSTMTDNPTSDIEYTVTGTDANSCENTASVTVTVRALPEVEITGNDVICEGEETRLRATGAMSYVWDDESTSSSILVAPTSTTTYSVTGTDSYGCVNEASLTVIMGSGEHETHHTVTACESYYWDISEDTYTASGTYPFNYTNNFGCVDYHILHLTINHIDTVRKKLTECDSYTWNRNGHTYTESTIDTVSYINENNCETVEILTLTIKKGTHQTDSVPACDSYLWFVNGETYTESGKHVFQYTNSDGCPSSKTLVLDVKHGTFNETWKTSTNSYTWNGATGETYYASGDYVYYYVNEEGCPSATTLHLTIEHRSDSCIYATANDVSCENRHDGRVSVFIPASIKNQCTVEWTLPDSTIRTDETLNGVSKGLYSVKVRSSLCQNVILFQDNVVVKNPCGVNVTITGPSEVTYSPCGGLPRITFYATITGGTPPYIIPGWNVNGSSASQTLTLSSGTNMITCHVIDAEGDSGDDLLKVFAKKIECAKDPNEIKGPSGYSEEEHFVNVTDKMNYTISFENDPDFAMAPASRVKITYDVPDEQRLASFRLTDFGFGDFMFTAPSNAASYSQRLDVSDSLGVWVDVNAGIDVVHRQLFWIFQSIDPATGAEPASSQMGFLSINDSLGHGEGYVSFYMIPESGLQTGDTVAAEAIIVFDDNAPIGTNVWRNTFDAVAPTSTLHAELNEQDSLFCTFTFTAQDDAGGSGVQSVEVYMSVNNGAYTSIGSCHPDSTLTYAMENGLNYRFVSAATDNVGNTESLKAQPDTAINFNAAPIDLVLDGNVFYENVPLNTYIGTFITLDDDINQQFTYELVNGVGSADNGLFQIVNNELRTNALFECSNRDEYEIRVRTTDIGGLSFEKAFIVSEIILHETPVTYERFSICQGESYAWNGMTLTSDGAYSVTIDKNDGCDSVVTLFLTVNPVYQTIITETICEGGSYNFFGQNYSQTGIYTHALQSVNGCDSIFTLNLIVNPASATNLSATACNSYVLNNTTYTQSGVYNQYLSNHYGCDSVVTLNLTIFHTDTTELDETACNSFVWNNQTYTQSGDYRQTFTNAEGCDSVVILHLTIRNSTYYVDTETACDTYTWIDGNVYTESNNTATYTLTNASGCDSVVTLNLTVNHSNTGVDVQTACESYTWIDGNTYTESNNTATYTLTNALGCDSVVTLNLTVNHSNTGVDVQTACETYTWIDGNTYTESNSSATYTLSNAAGCDSVVTLNLTINQSSTGIDVQTACDSFTWIDGNTYTESNSTATYTLSNAVGCDSVVTLNLTVIQSMHNVETETACEAFTWHGTTYTTSGTYTYAYTNADGCPSADTLQLTVNYGTHNAVTESACETFTWHDTTYTTSGTYTYEYNNADGCPSVDTLYLTVLYGTHNVVTETACESFTWHGTTYTTSGTYTYEYNNADGCPSADTLYLTVLYGTHNVETESACESFTWHGTTYTTSGTYTYAYTNADGCASADTLHLTVNHGTHNVDTETACETFTWHGQTYTESGTYTYAYTNAAGCASTDTLFLTILFATSAQFAETACDSYTWNGSSYTTSGEYVQTFTGANGCDSVVTLDLTIHYSTVSDFEITTADSCYEWNTQVYCETGDYVQTLQTTAGCDSVVTLHLTITVGIDDHDLSGIEVFPNPTNHLLNIKGEEMQRIDIYNADGQLVYTKQNDGSDLMQVDVSRYAAGQYFVKVLLGDGRTATRKFIVNRR